MRDLAGRPDLCAINTATLGFQAPIEDRHRRDRPRRLRRHRALAARGRGTDVAAIARRIRDAGLKVTGYCR